MKSGIVCLLCLVALVSSISSCSKPTTTQNSAPSQDVGPLFPATQNGKKGYIDKTGKFVINPQFDDAALFSEGLAIVKVGDKLGFIDKTGKMVINPQFDGPVDPYESPTGFAEGLAAVNVGGKYGYVDKTGKMVINPQFDWGDKFSEGLAVIFMGDKQGYIDKTGQIVIKPQYESAESFSEGLAFVALAEGKPGVKGLSDSTPVYEKTSSGKYSYIDKTGKEVLSVKPAEVTFVFRGKRKLVANEFSFAEGLALMSTSCKEPDPYNPMMAASCKHGYIDKTGKFVIESKFDGALPFSEGLASVKVGDKWGYIDKTGQMVISPQFDEANSPKRAARLKRLSEIETPLIDGFRYQLEVFCERAVAG